MKLGEITKVGAGQGAPQGTKSFGREGCPFIRAGSLDDLCADGYFGGLERVSSAVATEYGLHLYPANTIVFAKSGMSATKNRIFKLTQPAYVVNHLATIEPSSRVSPEFLRYWLEYFDPSRLIKDPSYPSISQEDIEDVEIDLPSLTDQNEVAATLRHADHLRSMRRHALQMCDELLPAAFLALFGDPTTNPHRFPVVELGNFLSFVTSGSRGWAEYYVPEGSRFIRSLDVRMNSVSNTDAVFVKPPQSAEADRTRVQTGDVLLTITGSRIGRVAPAPDRLSGAYISQHVAILRLKPGILPIFLSMFLSLDVGGQREIARVQYGQTKPGLNLQQIREFRIPLPPVDFQKTIVEVIQQNQHLHAANFERHRQADHLYQTLLHESFAISPVRASRGSSRPTAA